MTIFERYLIQQNNQYITSLDEPGKGHSIFVVIPCYNEPDIITTLNSLSRCTPPQTATTVLVVVNDADNSPQAAVAQNISTLESIANWQFNNTHSFFSVQRIYAHALPEKWAGVGWARKIGMDEVIKQIANNNLTEGIIVSLDADSTVSSNYLISIETAFKDNLQFNFFLINFEHPIGIDELSTPLREGIIRYELHMRYFRMAMEWSGYPHSIHTVGSSFALKASAYVRQGGMNRRKAGEDFYFLHKLVLLGHYGNINTATVYPASRISDRVPFGTGAALKKWMDGGLELHSTYSFEAFGHLKPFFLNSMNYWSMETDQIEERLSILNTVLQLFCKNSQSLSQLIELKGNCSSAKVFQNRFFHLFNAFWILKYLNFVHETSLKRGELKAESVKLLQSRGIQASLNQTFEKILGIFRDLDKRI